MYRIWMNALTPPRHRPPDDVLARALFSGPARDIACQLCRDQRRDRRGTAKDRDRSADRSPWDERRPQPRTAPWHVPRSELERPVSRSGDLPSPGIAGRSEPHRCKWVAVACITQSPANGWRFRACAFRSVRGEANSLVHRRCETRRLERSQVPPSAARSAYRNVSSASKRSRCAFWSATRWCPACFIPSIAVVSCRVRLVTVFAVSMAEVADARIKTAAGARAVAAIRQEW